MTDKSMKAFLARRHVRLTIHLAIAIGVAIGGWVIFNKNFARHFWVKNWGEVVEGQVYRSGLPQVRLIRNAMTDNNIGLLINLQGRDPKCPRQMAQETTAIELGIDELRFPRAGNGTPGKKNKGPRERAEVYASAIAAITEGLAQNKVVWIQCGSGTHRTGGITACYRMLVQGKPADEAYKELRSYGWKPWKHRPLTDFVNSHMQLIAEGLVARGVIDGVPSPLPHLGPVREDEPELITDAPPVSL